MRFATHQWTRSIDYYQPIVKLAIAVVLPLFASHMTTSSSLWCSCRSLLIQRRGLCADLAARSRANRWIQFITQPISE